MKNDSLGDRMKTYEGVTRNYLTRRMPVIIRLDGKAWHTFTKGFQKPFDMILMESMWNTCKYLCANIQGCKVAYTQSDEISLLLTDYEKITTSSWFDNNIQKMASISASMATLAFNKAFYSLVSSTDADLIVNYIENYYQKCYTAMFDSRIFNIPKEDACNCFIWRQQDATRNSIEAVGQANFSHKELMNKSCNDIQEMLWSEKNINWNDLPTYQKRGACICKEIYELNDENKTKRGRWVVDKDIPIFTQNREYIEKYL